MLHGTDVLVESAYMADLTVRTRKPVVFTGSMRYYSETGFDGIRNLLNGIKACVLPLPPSTGVVLLMTDRIFSARDVIKVHSLNVDAFEAPECGPVAYVAGEDVRLTHAAAPFAPGAAAADPGRPRRAPRRPGVLLHRHGRRRGRALPAAGRGGPRRRGVRRRQRAAGCCARAGRGRRPRAAGRADDPRSRRAASGPIYAYSGAAADLRSRGVILGGRLSAPKARVKLMVALGAGCPLSAIRRLFEEDI
ncbi:MAG: asparaginase domain-containing protein [Desulfobacterales bacterium]|nr:asparaginase domain-containing protein [Desulfobacterales bacterium]